MHIQIKETLDVNQADIITIYRANGWSSAEKPDLLYQAYLTPTLLLPHGIATN